MSNEKMKATGYLPGGPVRLPPVSGRRTGWQGPRSPLEPAEDEPVRSRRWPLVLAVVALVVAVLIMVGGFVQRADVLPVWVPLIGKDSGIAACEAMASQGAQQPISTGREGEGETTADRYTRLREVFADSRYADIRGPGVRFVDLLRQVDGMGQDAGLGALAFVGPLTEAYADLSGGCFAHGFDIPALGDR